MIAHPLMVAVAAVAVCPLMGVVVAVVVHLLMVVAVGASLLLRRKPMTMLTLDIYSNPTQGFQKPPVPRTALHRLFAAAIVSDQFRKTLLRAPEEALANGYLGQTFPLTDQEKKIIKTIRAENLTDFAQKVNQA